MEGLHLLSAISFSAGINGSMFFFKFMNVLGKEGVKVSDLRSIYSLYQHTTPGEKKRKDDRWPGLISLSTGLPGK